MHAPACAACGTPAFLAPAALRLPAAAGRAPRAARRRAPRAAEAARPAAAAAARGPRVAARSLFGGRAPPPDAGGAGAVRIERPLPNRRVVSCAVAVHAGIETVWAVLSDYGRLAEYIPNLAVSRVRPHPRGGIRLEQCGVQRILGFEFRAAVTMDMQEVGPADGRARAIDFTMVESRDFSVFEGTWRMEAVPGDELKTMLLYSVEIVPRGLVPVKAIEWRIGEDVPQNMNAVKRECELRRRQELAAQRRATLRAQEQ